MIETLFTRRRGVFASLLAGVSAVALAVSADPAWAQSAPLKELSQVTNNLASVTQQHADNEAEVDQSAATQAFVRVNQIGVGNEATITQSASLNSADVEQTGTDAGNAATILQSGDEAKAKVRQTGANISRIAQTGPLTESDIFQSGQDNVADTGQGGTGRGISLIEQRGDGNAAYLYQSGAATADIAQTGDGNGAYVVQWGDGNAVAVDQTANDAFASGDQSGGDNDLRITQTVAASAYARQSGRDNAATIDQIQIGETSAATGSLANLIQIGERNMIGIKQSVASSIVGVVQQGEDNRVHGAQIAGARTTSASDTASFHQRGDDNRAFFVQAAGGGHTLTLTQSGDGNQARIGQGAYLGTDPDSGGVDDPMPIMGSARNTALLKQEADDNLIELTQLGQTNLAQVTQSSDGNGAVIQQSGTGNSAIVRQ